MNPYEDMLEIKPAAFTEAQRALQRAVLSLNEEMEVCQISVKMLCAKANVARSTFYTYYEVVDDIMQEIEDELIAQLMLINDKFSTVGVITVESLDFFQDNLKLVLDNKKLFYLFLVKRPNNRFVQKWKRGIKYHFYYRLSETKVGNDKELILEMIAAQAIAAYTFWLQNPYEINLDMVKRLITDTMKIYEWRLL